MLTHQSLDLHIYNASCFAKNTEILVTSMLLRMMMTISCIFMIAVIGISGTISAVVADGHSVAIIPVITSVSAPSSS